MNGENDAIDKMIEREKYRKIAEKYRSKKNDRYRKRVPSRRNLRHQKDEEEKFFKIPVRFAVCVLLLGGFIYYINSGRAETEMLKEKVRTILSESIELAVSGNGVKNLIPWEMSEKVEVEERILNEMEESEYTPQFP